MHKVKSGFWQLLPTKLLKLDGAGSSYKTGIIQTLSVFIYSKPNKVTKMLRLLRQLTVSAAAAVVEMMAFKIFDIKTSFDSLPNLVSENVWIWFQENNLLPHILHQKARLDWSHYLAWSSSNDLWRRRNDE